jgi:hypothetical protein
MKARRFIHTRPVRQTSGESYLRAAARRAAENLKPIRALASQMRRVADTHLLRGGIDMDTTIYRRTVTVDGYKAYVTLTRTVADTKHFYQFSIGNDEGDPDLIPELVIERLTTVFVPRGIQFPSLLGNTIQFIEVI